MRAALLFAALVALGACSSNAVAPPAVDAGGGASALGTKCNPTLGDPCEQPSDACSIAVCDPTSHLCLRVAVDAGPACASGNPACASGDCDAAAGAGDAAIDGGHAIDGGDAGVSDASTDATTDAESDATTDAESDAAIDAVADAVADAPADAADSGD